MEADHLKAVQHQLRQINSEISEFKSMVSKVKDKFTNLETEQASIKKVIKEFSEILQDFLGSETSKQRELEELQSKCTYLNNKLLGMTEELFNVQMEKEDLESQLRDISASAENKSKVSEKGMESSNMKSY